MKSYRLGVSVGLMLLAGWAWAQEPLPSNVAFKLRDVERVVDRAERVIAVDHIAEADKIAAARSGAAEARGVMAELERRYAGKYDPQHPEIVAMAARIDALEATAQGREAARTEAQAAAAAQSATASAASADWLARLQPYVIGIGRSGHDPAKYLVPSATHEAEEMQRRLAIHAAASADLEGYRQAHLGANATDELQEVVSTLAVALQDFGNSCAQYAAEDLAEADRQLNEMEAFCRTQEAKVGQGETILFLDRFQMEQAQNVVDRAAGLSKDTAKIDALRARLKAVAQADVRLRAARAADTRLRPDAYGGNDAAELKKAAEDIVAKAAPGCRRLKTIIATPDWRMESVVEWTDSTRTALRHRTTRSVVAECAARVNADTRLYTIHLSQDRQPDGHWGPIQGHVMFTDPMLEANVK